MSRLDILIGKLNEVQRAVVMHDSGHAAVFAVAGAGKTTTMTARIARMIRDGVNPERILAVTFTRAAAGAMNDKLSDLGVSIRKGGGDGARVGTFHSLCLEVIRDGSEWERFEVDDKDQMHNALKDILGFRGMDWKGADITEVQGFIGECKNALVKPEDSREYLIKKAKDTGGWADMHLPEAFERYEVERLSRGLLTFDDMLSSAVYYLEASTEARDRWGSRYEHVMIDEFQDTNIAQYRLTELLCGPSVKSLMVVGDDDQLIYQWRGSKPEFTLGFTERWKATSYFAETNYRSRPEILEVANRVIVNNKIRVSKLNKAVRSAGGTVTCSAATDLDDEAVRVADRISDRLASGGKFGDCAVLYRTNAQSRAFEEELIKRSIPHIVLGGTDFYSRKEVADLLAYLRLVADPSDDEAFKRAVNRPFRFIGRATLDKIESGKRGRPMIEAARAMVNGGILGLTYKQKDSIVGFVALIERLREMVYPAPNTGLDPIDLPGLLTRIIGETRYLEWLTRDEGKDTTENSRTANVKEFIRTAGRFRNPEALLEYVTKLREERKRRKLDEKIDAVLLMTIHKSKGLEWPCVFVAGASEEILPHACSMGNIEEERRLFYVAVTRAMDEVHITSPKAVLGAQGPRGLEPSRFLAEAGLKVSLS